jgi:AcrR family transcriptional regulator
LLSGLQFFHLEAQRVPRSREPTRRRILDAAYLLFRARGYARVSVDEIAAAATVTKRTLYRHFESKDVIVEAILEAQHRLALTSSRTLSHFSRTADELVDVLFSEIATWSATSRWAGSGFTRVVIELADLPGHPARVIARRHKAMLEAHVANQLSRLHVGAPVERARQIWLLAEGAMVSALIHQDPRYGELAARTAKDLLRYSRRRIAGDKKKAVRRRVRGTTQ